MVKGKLTTSFTCMFVLTQLSLVTLKTIHVSNNEQSKDISTCGGLSQPCYHLDYAINMSLDSDTISLDVEYEYEHNGTLQIPHRLNLSSYGDNSNASLESILLIKNVEEDIPIKLAADLILDKITLRIYADDSKVEYMFHIDGKNVQKLAIYGSMIEFMTTSPMDLISEPYQIDIDIKNTIIFSRQNQEQLNPKYRKLSRFQERNNDKINIQMVNSSFKGMDFEINPMKGVLVNILVSNCTFVDISFNMLALAASNVTFINNHLKFRSLLTFMSNPMAFKPKASSFKMENNNLDIGILFLELYTAVDVNVKNCKFNYSTMHFRSTKESQNFVIITIENSTFTNGITDPFIQADLTKAGIIANNKILTIKDCLFQKATAGVLLATGYAFSMAGTSVRDNYIDDYLFGISMSAGLTINSYSISLYNCTFTNNNAPVGLPNSIRIEPNHFIKPFFSMSHVIIKSGTNSKAKVNNVVFISQIPAEIHPILKNVNVYCSNSNYNIKLFGGETFYQARLISCIRCDGGSYNAHDQSHIELKSATERNIHNATCYDCPYQASCINGIKSKGNYWGQSNSSGFVTFYLCPSFYCCPTLKTCPFYNSCMNNREGRLCGACKTGHSLSLFSQNKCVKDDQCSKNWFWFIYTCICILVFIIFLYYKDIFKYLKNIKLCHSSERVSVQESNSETESDSILSSPYTLIEDEEESSKSKGNSTTTFSGTIKIIFFYYQTASIIRINASAKAEYTMPNFISVITSFFSITIDISSSEYGDICPIQTSNVAIIKAFRTSLIFACLFFILTTMLICCLYNLYRYYCVREIQNQSSFINRLKGSYVQLLTLGYASIATFCLQSIHCIKINGSWYLYYQAEQVCYQQWQTVILVIIFVWVVPFPFALYVGCRWLRTNKITTNKFLVTITFPPLLFVTAILICFKRDLMTELNEQMEAEKKNILSILNEPFRKTDLKDKACHRLIWEPVLITRRLMLIASETFLMSPIQKLYPVLSFLIIFTVHDYFAKPYTEKKLNFLQMISMKLLVVLTFINSFWAYSNDIDLTQDVVFYDFGKFLLYFELIILLMPLLLLIFFSIFKYLYKLCLRKQH